MTSRGFTSLQVGTQGRAGPAMAFDPMGDGSFLDNVADQFFSGQLDDIEKLIEPQMPEEDLLVPALSMRPPLQPTPDSVQAPMPHLGYARGSGTANLGNSSISAAHRVLAMTQGEDGQFGVLSSNDFLAFMPLWLQHRSSRRGSSTIRTTTAPAAAGSSTGRAAPAVAMCAPPGSHPEAPYLIHQSARSCICRTAPLHPGSAHTAWKHMARFAELSSSRSALAVRNTGDSSCVPPGAHA